MRFGATRMAACARGGRERQRGQQQDGEGRGRDTRGAGASPAILALLPACRIHPALVNNARLVPCASDPVRRACFDRYVPTVLCLVMMHWTNEEGMGTFCRFDHPVRSPSLSDG